MAPILPILITTLAALPTTATAVPVPTSPPHDIVPSDFNPIYYPFPLPPRSIRAGIGGAGDLVDHQSPADERVVDWIKDMFGMNDMKRREIPTIADKIEESLSTTAYLQSLLARIFGKPVNEPLVPRMAVPPAMSLKDHDDAHAQWREFHHGHFDEAQRVRVHGQGREWERKEMPVEEDIPVEEYLLVDFQRREIEVGAEFA
ncbi:hypothetical protein LTR09_010573 [Extremus antarcticus]|uniref:Uncharacterized protein n=1 Tax=Extremus antarcticus TaxID=702011 RepID=A0AAJ0DDD3_9PEZI|nr:hypothetical protein LTR09_010573 [Extremus antarcticus]